MAPILPFSSEKLWAMLNIESPLTWDSAAQTSLPAGHVLNNTEIIFKKIEDDVIDREVEKLSKIDKPETKAKAKGSQSIDFELFKKVQLKTGRIQSAERVQGADKLLKLQVQLGDESRQIVAGIAQSYSPEELTGKTVIVVANLKPAKIRGIESQGMLLAVKSKTGFSLLTPDSEVEAGLPVE
jgi:methionyl-tRNA synthetase